MLRWLKEHVFKFNLTLEEWLISPNQLSRNPTASFLRPSIPSARIQRYRYAPYKSTHHLAVAKIPLFFFQIDESGGGS